MGKLRAIVLIALLASFALSSQARTSRPNILLVMLDDVGYMDFGAYGSDTATPTIDKLAKAGVMLTNYHTTPQCGPSRASALTGQSNHKVGMGSIVEASSDEMRELPAYSMLWADDQATIASRLKAAGYQTFVTGKWGIGHVGKNLPNRFGFDRSWVLDATGSSNYSNKSYLPMYKSMQWYEDGRPISLPDDFYSSRDIVDKMISYVGESNPEKPFFGYLSFQAVHMPIQVSEDYIEKYDGVFNRGWDVMREERLQKAIALGLVPKGTKLSAGAYNKRAWDALSEEEKAYWKRVMQVNAGMMEAADFHLGRLLGHLQAAGRLDNTIVIVTSDNGPEFATIGKTSLPAERAIERLWMAIEGWDVAYENLGQSSSIAAIGHDWASVSAAPFHLFKFSAAEGGLRVPLVIAGPGIKDLGLIHGRAQVADIVPTVLGLARVDNPAADFDGRSLVPMLQGRSEQVYGEKDSIVIEVSGAAALYQGNWKLTRTPPPFGEGSWQLFNLSTDPGETTNVAAEQPVLFQKLVSDYNDYAKKVGVYETPSGGSARQQIVRNALKKMAMNYWYVVLAMFCVLAAATYGAFRLTTYLWAHRPAHH